MYEPNATYFLTTTVTGFTKIFHIPELMTILINNLSFYRQKFAVKIHGYVIMPNHFHLLVSMGNKGNVSQFMGQFKQYTAKQILAWCEKEKKINLLEIFEKSADTYKPSHRYQVWQERFDDVLIDDGNVFDTKLDYIHHNPLQEHWQLAESPEDYRFSSAAYYILGKENIIPIEPIEPD